MNSETTHRAVIRVVAIAAAAFFMAVAVAVEASAAPPPIPPWAARSSTYGIDTDTTGWSIDPHMIVSAESGQQIDIVLGEPYWNGTNVALRVTGTNDVPGAGIWSAFKFNVNVICQSSLGVLTIGGTNGVLAASSGGGSAATDVDLTGTYGPTTATCGGNTPVGVQVRVEVGLVPIPPEISAYGCGLVSVCVATWYPDDEHVFGGPDFVWCRATFGPDYTPNSTAIIQGEEVTAYEVGCDADFINDAANYTNFDYVCAGAPATKWFDYSWLGPWIGHYVECLFVPRGGLDTEYAVYEINEGWVGDVRTMLVTLSTEAGTWSGGCGALIADLPGAAGGITTCALIGTMPPAIRTTAGAVLVAMVSIGSLYLFFEIMGIGVKS